MKRLLMFLYLMLVMSEAKPTQKRGWHLFGHKTRKAVHILESGVFSLPKVNHAEVRSSRTIKPSMGPGQTQSTALDLTPSAPTAEPQHKKVVEVIPKTLVEREAECAIVLQLPNKPTGPQKIRPHGNARFDTPIGRTLTREKMLKDWQHVPRVAIAHLPIDDVSRLVAKGAITTPHTTSPRARGTEKKGRPTPKRPRRRHGAGE